MKEKETPGWYVRLKNQKTNETVKSAGPFQSKYRAEAAGWYVLKGERNEELYATTEEVK